MISFTNQQTLYSDFSQNTSSANLARGASLANIEHRYLLQKYFNNEGSYTDVTVENQQFYKLPPNYSKLKTVTITTGQLKWTPTEILTREEWDKLNVFPYTADYPSNYFIYPGGDHGGQIGFWPIPSSDDNVITYNYKYRVPDLSIADYTTPGTVSIVNGGTTVTGAGTTFTTTKNAGYETRWIQFAQPTGDNLWYQIASVDSTTSITLYQPYQGVSIVASSAFAIGQMPLLMEDFQDMLVWKPLVFYFSSIVDNPNKKQEFEGLYNEKLKMLDEYAGRKTINVNLGRKSNYLNPNLFWQGS